MKYLRNNFFFLSGSHWTQSDWWQRMGSGLFPFVSSIMFRKRVIPCILQSFGAGCALKERTDPGNNLAHTMIKLLHTLYIFGTALPYSSSSISLLFALWIVLVLRCRYGYKGPSRIPENGALLNSLLGHLLPFILLFLIPINKDGFFATHQVTP